ncbi:lysM and putative peptidoglycan-binding domain-containing protein 3-like [Rhopilema esculentum]|uniref:lysM and putative peptidoglycan-binding domain-containing protein 3-like n=1 Tax=Rhopilema esculentum TaxID=499914 RepID=UPI0031DBD1CF
MSPIGEQKRLPNRGNDPKASNSWREGSDRPMSLGKKNDLPVRSYSSALKTAENQNSSSHRIFVFGQNEEDLIEMDNGSIEMAEIRSRNRKEHGRTGANYTGEDMRKSHFIDHNMEPDDTLAKLSLKYGCSVTQLKQANGIYNDQDFFARRTLKIPVFVHSFLWELSGNRKNSLDSKIDHLRELTRSQSEGSFRHVRENMMYEKDRVLRDSVHPSADYSYSDDDSNEMRSLLHSAQDNSKSLNDTNNLYEEYLELVDKDIKNISSKVQSKSDIVDIGGQSLAYMQPNLNDSKKDDKLGQAGWLSYKGIILVVCTVAVLLPVMYIVYFLSAKKNR